MMVQLAFYEVIWAFRRVTHLSPHPFLALSCIHSSWAKFLRYLGQGP